MKISLNFRQLSNFARREKNRKIILKNKKYIEQNPDNLNSYNALIKKIGIASMSSFKAICKQENININYLLDNFKK